jgi:hypothetical protein
MPLGQALGTRRHDRSEGSRPTPSTPPGRPSAEVQGDPRGTPRRASPRPLREVSQNRSKSSATTLPGGRTDHLNTLAQHPPKRSSKDPAGPLREFRQDPPRSPRRPRKYARSVRSERVFERPRGTTGRAPPPPSAEGPQTTSARSLSTLREGLRETPPDHSARSATPSTDAPPTTPDTLRHHPPQRAPRPPQHARSAPSEKVV